MTSREGLIARQEDAIVRLHEDTQSVPEHPDESRATDNDKCVNLSEEIIADNLRMIAKLRGGHSSCRGSRLSRLATLPVAAKID